MSHLTRRQIAIAALGGAPALAAQQGEPKDALTAAREEVNKTIAALKKFDLPRETEPAFVFQP